MFIGNASNYFQHACHINIHIIIHTFLAKTGHGPHSSKLVVICVVLCTVCMYMCTVLLPPGDNPIAVNKYTNINNVHS